MKNLSKLIGLSVLLILCNAAIAQTIWNGSPITFTKENFANWTLPENQDRIMEDIWITRANSKPIFNFAEENIQGSPKNTQWALGSISDGVENLQFNDWLITIDETPPDAVGQPMVLYLMSEQIYIDIMFTSWTSGDDGGGGGFSYERSTGDLSETYWTGSVLTFTKSNFADWTLPENQDRITDQTWITRANQRGLFNMVVEDEYDMFQGMGDSFVGSPHGTQWAFGNIADGVENLEFNIWAIAVELNPPGMVGNPMVLYLEKENIYIDILFTSWTSGEGEGGGGFSYERSTGDLSETYWTGPNISFTKENYADWTLPENQDRITDQVYMTRADNRGLFNIAVETEYVYTISAPAKTLWAFGSTSDGIENLEFDYFTSKVDFEPPTAINQPMVLQLEPYDIYIDIMFHSWTSGENGGGGGFSYTRSTDATAIREIVSDQALFYPNPAKHSIRFYPGAVHSKASFQLYDLTGHKVMDFTVRDQESINCSGLTPGLYLYKLIENGPVKTGKMIIE